MSIYNTFAFANNSTLIELVKLICYDFLIRPNHKNHKNQCPIPTTDFPLLFQNG